MKKKLIIVSGYFNPLHKGHVEYFHSAKNFGDDLMVIVNNDIQRNLKENHIPSVSYYSVPLHLQPVFENLGHKEMDFPVAEKVANQCLSLPMSPYLADEDQAKIINALRKDSNSEGNKINAEASVNLLFEDLKEKSLSNIYLDAQ